MAWVRVHLQKVFIIDGSQRAWLTGDLTNHNAESALLLDKHIRQESRLTSVDFNLKNCVLTSFPGWNKIRSDVHSCLFCALSKYERLSFHAPLVLRLYSDLSRHIKELRVWEGHGLLNIATVTKEDGILWRVNCNSCSKMATVYCKKPWLLMPQKFQTWPL